MKTDCTVVVVEDETAVREVVARALSTIVSGVETACDGKDGLDRVASLDGDCGLLLTDICMPIMDGISLSKHVHARWPHIPILLMTGFAEGREQSDEVKRFVQGVLPKPFTLPALRQAVSSVLGPAEPDCQR